MVLDFWFLKTAALSAVFAFWGSEMFGQDAALMGTYARQPVAFERGAGAWLWDTRGERYLDALSGIAVCGLGHAHPQVAQAIGAGRDPGPHLEPVPGAAAGHTGRESARAGRNAAGKNGRAPV